MSYISTNAKLIKKYHQLFKETIIAHAFIIIIFLVGVFHTYFFDLSYIDISLYTTTVLLKPKINMRKEGFSSVIFNMADGVNFIEFNNFRNITSTFFKTLKSDKKYFFTIKS